MGRAGSRVSRTALRALCERAAADLRRRHLRAEIFEDLPDPDVIFVPIGGGSGACGCCIVRSGLGKKARGDRRAGRRAPTRLRARGADPSAYRWRASATFAEGLATRYTFDLTFDILKRELDDIVTLTEGELEEGVRLALRATHNLAEGAGAASLAAAIKLRDQLRGQTVVCVMSGGNISTMVLKRIC